MYILSFTFLCPQELNKKFVWWWVVVVCKPILVFYFGVGLRLGPSRTKIEIKEQLILGRHANFHLDWSVARQSVRAKNVRAWTVLHRRSHLRQKTAKAGVNPGQVFDFLGQL